MSKIFRRNVQRTLAKILFPVTHQDWYKKKGFGTPEKESFDDFLYQQEKNQNARLYNEFQNLSVTRKLVTSFDYRGNQCQLDSVSISPDEPKVESGKGIHIINFFGRLEYYECNYRDMARQAHATGATIHAYNPPGMNSSTGKVIELNDLINAGIAQINKLLEDGVLPSDIIIQGNCMGAAVAEEVNQHFKKMCSIEFRRINSNSFKSMNSLLTYLYPILSHIKDKVIKILNYAGWQSKPGKLFEDTSPYKVYMSRQNDKTIKSGAKMEKRIKKTQAKLAKLANSNEKLYGKYAEDKQWLDEHAEMVLDSRYLQIDKNTNPHELELFKLKSLTGSNITAFDFINRYISASNKFIEANPQPVDLLKLSKGAPYLFESSIIDITQQVPNQEEILSDLGEFVEIVHEASPSSKHHQVTDHSNVSNSTL